MKISFLSLAVSALGLGSSLAQAKSAYKQQCAGFESPADTYNTTLEISSLTKATSLLIYRLGDIPHSNIPFPLTDDIFTNTADGSFFLCTKNKVTIGACVEEQLGLFTVRTDGQEDLIINTYMQAGESTIYNVDKLGTYCALVYQEDAAEVTGIVWKEQHSWGGISLLKWEYIQTLSLELIWSVILAAFTYSWVRKFGKESILFNLNMVCYVKLFTVSGIHAAYVGTDPTNSFTSGVRGQLVKCNANLFTMAYTTILLAVSSGIFGVLNDKGGQLLSSLSKKQKVLFLLYTPSLAISGLLPVFGLSLLNQIASLCEVITVFVWIPVYWNIWKTAKNTEKINSLDPVFARNLRVSRKLVFLVPVFISLTSVFVVAVLSHSTAPPDLTTSIGSLFTQSIDDTISTNRIFILLKHLPEFSSVVVLSCLLYVWRPTSIEKGEPIALPQEIETVVKTEKV